MIIKGKPELGLQQHQQEAYTAITNAYKIRNKASVVIPTGCGKSFISLQLMIDNKDKNILFMAPTNAIKDQMYRYIAKYIAGEEPTTERPAKMIAEEQFPNLRIILYPSLLRMKNEIMENLNPDIIIMDELHRTGADKWGEKIDDLININPNAKILGLTATPDRMDDKNIVDDLFCGNVDYELTLVDAIQKGIVQAPNYVKCDYSLRDSLESIKTAIEQCSNPQTKKELQERYDKMRRIVEHAEGIPALFAKNMTKKDGKYIVFCKDKQHMDELIESSKEWFANIDTNPEIYSVYSGEGYSEKVNKNTIKSFEASKSKHLKLLFSVDMLNEGLHVEDISGVIMLRPTESRIIYLQQLGRTLSSDTSREKTIVFDLVNNYLKNNLDAEINQRKHITGDFKGNTTNIGGLDGKSLTEDIDIFRIQGETKEFLELFNEVQGILGHNDHLTNALNIKTWMEQRKTIKPPSSISKDFEEKRLGIALSNIRQTLIKPYLQLKTEQEKKIFEEEHPEFKKIFEIINWIDENNISLHLINARQIKFWMEEKNSNKPPRLRCNDKEEQRLGTALQSIRLRLLNPYLQIVDEEEKLKFENKHPELQEVMQIVNWIDGRNLSPNLVNARDIKIWMQTHKTTKSPSAVSKDAEEKRLGTALTELRRNLIKPYMQLETEEEKLEFSEKHPEIDEVLQIINWIDTNKVNPNLTNVRNIKAWMEERKTTKPPSSNSKDKEEKRLGRALGNIKRTLVKTYMQLGTQEKEEFEQEHPEFREIMEIINWIDENNISPYLINARDIKQWVEQNQFAKLPSRSSKAVEEERELGKKLSYIRQDLIGTYMKLQTEQEREIFREKHPEIDKVMSIISELDIQCGNAKQKELAILIRQDLEKRKALQEAKKLEKDYKEQLAIRKANVIETQEQGVDINE